MESESSIASYWRQIQHQQQLLHQALMYRHQTILSHLREVARQVQALRQENADLKTANLELNNRVKMLLNTTPSHGVGLGSGLDGLSEIGIGTEEEGTSESETAAKSPTSVMDSIGVGVDRVHLPKSISVRSTDYLKAVRAGKGGDCVGASNRNKIDNGTQKVYVKGSEKEEAVEVEVYKQGMFKTELCNKWQQTGTCPYGEICQFAHGIEELRPIIRHPRYKTELCRMLLNHVPCPYGHRCHFRHALTDEERLERATNPKSIVPMNYWW
ncbi:zinc finger CCCH domain-containing protein 15 [Phtheirospermum japonicum]|uniref:Zinc finger CCCH domain-containing protein 15 n=1 Tax=Phtheirospermum japonicum TaxID=374723 RepID=A0A830CUI1_9LAMI|nr:zinc finger CCCH domain-containing protein 15 [Phtheirospermum japonicum]